MMRLWVNSVNRRYYRAHLQPDLFGDWTLTRCWGSLDSYHGQVRKKKVDGQATVEQLIIKIAMQRALNGYHSII